MEYQFFGVWELWPQTLDLLASTLRIPYASLQKQAFRRAELLAQSGGEVVEGEVQRLREDPLIRSTIEAMNKKDVQMYQRALLEFKRRCRYFNIEVPDDPYRLPSHL
ncbi:unnamed protein product [Discosporangium mesarthrocarpum]